MQTHTQNIAAKPANTLLPKFDTHQYNLAAYMHVEWDWPNTSSSRSTGIGAASTGLVVSQSIKQTMAAMTCVQ